MASRQSNSAETSKKSPQTKSKSPQKVASKNEPSISAPTKDQSTSSCKVTPQMHTMSLDGDHHHHQPSKRTSLDSTQPKMQKNQAAQAQPQQQQKQTKKQQGSGSPSSSAKGLKKTGSVGSNMSDTSSSSDLKVPKDFKKGKRASVAEVPMREEPPVAGAASAVDDDDEDAAALEWFVDEEYLKEFDKESKPEDKQHRRELADNLKMEGNDIYKKSEYAEAARFYTAALRTLPLSYGNERAILYSNRAACFLYMDELDEGILDCSKALEINPNYLKAILRRAQLYEKMEKLDEALTDYRKVLELEPKDPKALEACVRLPEEIRERNDKLKTEMLGKLKDLGNMILKPFGLSTDNFKLQQDPNSGSYSINLEQNK